MKKILITLFLLFLTTINAYCLEDGLSITTLPSGQKVVIKEVHDNPIVKIDTWIKTGSINEDDTNNGLSHFLEHLFFKGTKKYPTGAFDKILDAKGTVVNAATSKDYTHYYIEIPSEHFDLALSMHADMLLNPEIPQEELDKERGVVIEEISKTKDSPFSRMFDNAYTLLYSKSNHPYKRNVIGTKEIIQNVSRDEILKYFKRFYTPDAYTTVIVGDIEKLPTLKKIAENFNQQKRTQEKIKYPTIKPIDKIERVSESMDINKSHTMIAFLAPKFTDTKDNFALDVLSTMLSSGKSSILNQELKEKQELALSVSTGNYSKKDSGIFYFYATYKPENEEDIEKAIIAEIKNIQAGKFSDATVEKAKNQMKTDTLYSRESISNIADELGYIYTFTTDTNYYDDYLKNIDKVTKEDIIKVAKKYLITDKYIVSTVKPKSFEITKKEKEPLKQTNNILLEEDKTTKKYLLENGATLITKKKNANSIIAINISIKGSKAIEDKPTSASMAASTVSSGTLNYTNAQFAKFLDENGIKLGVASTNDIFEISIQATKENLDKVFMALDEIINNPVFSDVEINKIKQRKIQELKAISDSPSSYVFDEFKKLAFLNTIYGQNSEFVLKNINSLTREDIIKFYSKVIDPQNMSIAIVGDIDEKYIQDKLNEIIKPNPNGQKFQYSNQKFSAYKPEKNIETKLYKDEVQANWMALGYKTCGTLNRKDTAVLTVINSILSSGMSSRLFVNLREKQSLAYVVGSSLSTNVLDGAFITYIGTNANSIDKAKQGLFKEIEKIKTEPVSKEELQDAKDRIMGKLLLSLETNMDEAELLSWYSTIGLTLEGFEEYKAMINEITTEDILNVAKKYFNTPYIYTVVLQK